MVKLPSGLAPGATQAVQDAGLPLGRTRLSPVIASTLGLGSAPLTLGVPRSARSFHSQQRRPLPHDQRSGVSS
jgi:hypothetical protein